MSQNPEIHTGISAVDQMVKPILIDHFSPEPVAEVTPMQTVTLIVAYVWVTGAVLLLLYALISYGLLTKKVKASIHIRDNIELCDDIETPFILGVIKPRIYIPSGLSDTQMSHVIAHERAHLQRFDHLWKPLGFVILAMHWFNPFTWVAYAALCKDIEIACDEKVIRHQGKQEAVSYSQSLLECSVKRRNILVCPLAFGEVSVKERIRHVLQYRKPRIWIILIAIIACVAIGICFLTNPKKEEAIKIEDLDGDGEEEVEASYEEEVISEESIENEDTFVDLWAKVFLEL